MSDDKKQKKDKKKGKGDEAADGKLTVSIAAHPRAKAGVRRARTRAAFLAFVLVLVLNLLGDQALFDAVWRALLAGIVVNVVVWRCAIVVWRHIIVSEIAPGGGAARRAPPAERERMEKQAAEQATSVRHDRSHPPDLTPRLRRPRREHAAGQAADPGAARGSPPGARGVEKAARR